ncbi:MAG: PepSY-associated TM helix domain-containing protein, partial [Acidimicrobiia bacterium]
RSGGAVVTRRGRSTRRNETHKAFRFLHTYTSMIALVIVLFFGVTGLTLNHPTWTLGQETSRSTNTGTLPSGFVDAAGNVDFLAVTEYVRNTDGVRGSVSDYGTTAGEGTVSFKSPGYAADLVFKLDDGSYQVTIEEDGFLAVMNDLHKGRYADSSWKWLIDISAVFLVVIALTGLGLQFFLKRRRTKAFVVAGIGGVVTLIMIIVTVR